MKNFFAKAMLILLAVCVIFGAAPVAALANDEPVSSEPASLDLAQGSIYISKDSLGNYVFSQDGTELRTTSNSAVIRQTTASGSTTANVISINSGSISLTIVDLNIHSQASCITIGEGAELELNLVGVNTLNASNASYACGIELIGECALTIQGIGSLTATGGVWAAGIGGGDEGDNNGNITITGGTVTATGVYGAGIGGGYEKNNNGAITISGGAVTATGTAGIGGGGDNNGNITISGGEVTATGSGAGIGGGWNGHNNGSIIISGGKVSATGGSSAAGIGGGTEGSGGRISIFDAEITVEGWYHAIGGGGLKNSLGCTELIIDESATVIASYSASGGSEFQEKIVFIKMDDSEALSGNDARFVIEASAPSGLGYQWQSSADGRSWEDISGAVSAALALPINAENNGYFYRCELTNGFGNGIYSDAFEGYVLAFLQQPQDVETYFGDSVFFAVESSGDNMLFQWQLSYDGISWHNIPGETLSTLFITSTTINDDETLFRCVITAANGDSLASDAARMTVDSPAITYTTHFYCEKADGSGYELIGKQVKTAVAGSSVNALARSYDFFTENTSLGTHSGIVKADSSLVLSRYFDRNSYTLSFEMNGGPALSALTGKFGSAISAPPNPTRFGYVFDGWYSDEDMTEEFSFTTMPGGGATIYAKWKAIGEVRGLEYEITGIKLRDSGNQEIFQIPTGNFFAEVSVKNLSSQTMDTLVLAYYDAQGRMLGLQYLYANPSIGETDTLSTNIENKAGNIYMLKAFMLPVLGGAVPLAEAVEFMNP